MPGNPLRRLLDVTRPRVESADEFLGGDPGNASVHVAQTAAAPMPARTWGAITVILAVVAAIAIALWLVTQRPFEPAPTLASDQLTRYAAGQGLLCDPPGHTEVGLHWSCHSETGDGRTLDWFGPSNRRATVLQATGAVSWLGDVAALGVPASRRDESRQWVVDHAHGGQTGYGPVDLQVDPGQGAQGTTLTVDIH